MIIEHKTDVRWLLLEWGAWRKSWLVGPRRVRSWWGAGIMERFLPQVHVHVTEIIVDEPRAWRTDQVIKTIGHDQREGGELALVLLSQYVFGGTKEQRAKRCGLTLKTYQRRRRQAEQGVQNKLGVQKKNAKTVLTSGPET